MKPVLLMVLVISSNFFQVTAQEKITADKIPSALLKKFNTDFSKAEKVTWRADKDTGYSVTYYIEGVRHGCKYDKKNMLVGTDRLIKYMDLPEPVQKNMAANFIAYKPIVIAEFKKRAETTYRILLMKGKEMYSVIYLPTGALKVSPQKMPVK